MTPINETKQTEKTESDLNVLSAEERALLLGYNAAATNAKIAIHDLDCEAERIAARKSAAKNDLKQAEHYFGAALAACGASRKLAQPVTISSDFTRIEGAK